MLCTSGFVCYTLLMSGIPVVFCGTLLMSGIPVVFCGTLLMSGISEIFCYNLLMSAILDMFCYILLMLQNTRLSSMTNMLLSPPTRPLTILFLCVDYIT